MDLLARTSFEESLFRDFEPTVVASSDYSVFVADSVMSKLLVKLVEPAVVKESADHLSLLTNDCSSSNLKYRTSLYR